MSDQKVSQFNQFSRFANSDKPSFNGQRNSNRNNDKQGHYNNDKQGRYNNDKRGYDDKRNNKEVEYKIVTQKEPKWYDSSEFCRTNRATGAVKWKEEFWHNTAPLVRMIVVPGKNGEKITVPSNWKFQNMEAGHFKSKSGKTFAYECAMQLHQRELAAM